jgi:hypothetical protein
MHMGALRLFKGLVWAMPALHSRDVRARKQRGTYLDARWFVKGKAAKVAGADSCTDFAASANLASERCFVHPYPRRAGHMHADSYQRRVHADRIARHCSELDYERLRRLM